jgi:hypothetical protein
MAAMPNPDQSLALRTCIEEAADRSTELRHAIDRIVEVWPNDKFIQELDQLVDVLMAKLSAASIRASRPPRK